MKTYKKHIHPSIEICRECGGTGDKYYFAENDYREENLIRRDCCICDGAGRVVISKEIITKVEAFSRTNQCKYK